MNDLLEIYTFGGLNIMKAQAPVSNFASRKAEVLILYLACMPRTHPREVLAELLWDERAQGRARNNLRVLITSIRQNLESHFNITRDVVGINADSHYWLDCLELEKQINGVQEEWTRTRLLSQSQVAQLERALELYQGDFLEGVFVRDSLRFEAWISHERERFQRMVIETLSLLVNAYLNSRNYAMAARHVDRLQQLDAMREETYRQRMLLLARQGERVAALEHYSLCCQMLDEEFNLKPSPETTALYEKILSGEIGALSPAAIMRDLPPQETDLIGRQDELRGILDFFQNSPQRLLTLVGPSGVGKTRLAREIADQVEGFEHGVCFISLASLSSADFLVSTIGDAVGLSFAGKEDPTVYLLNYLRPRNMLLILDNFEHLVQRADLVAQILDAARRIKILVTSSERLNLQDEWVQPIGELDCPPPDKVDQIESYSAVKLFLHHARRARSNFVLAAEDRRHVVRICRLVEGMPLALELAAAWTRMLPCEEISREIEASLNFLAWPRRDVPTRHKSLRAVFEHGWNLLTLEERNALKKLSIFRGSFGREVTRAFPDVSFPILSALIDKSLVRSNLMGRYQLPEIIRQYAEEKLDESVQESQKTRNLHCGLFASFMQEREATLASSRRRADLEEIKGEIENVRTAWQWAVTQRNEEEINRFLTSLWFFYESQNRYREAEEMFRRAVESLQADIGAVEEKTVTQGRLLARRGWFLYRVGLTRQGKAHIQRSLAIVQHHGAWREIGYSLTLLGLVSNTLGEYEEAQRLCQESLAVCEETGDRWGMAISLNVLGNIARKQGRFEDAALCFQESLAMSRESGDQLGVAISLNDLGQLAFEMGEYEEARSRSQQGHAIGKSLEDRLGMAISLDRLGKIAHALGEYAEAKRLFEESLALSREISDQAGMLISLKYLGDVFRVEGNYSQAREALQEALTMARKIANRRSIAFSLNSLGSTAVLQAAYDEATDLFRESLEISEAVGNNGGMADALRGLGDSALALGDNLAARTYYIKALKAAIEGRLIYQILETLTVLAAFLAHDHQTEWALELSYFVMMHSGTWDETKARLKTRLPGLETKISREALEVIHERARHKTLETVIAPVLEWSNSQAPA